MKEEALWTPQGVDLPTRQRPMSCLKEGFGMVPEAWHSSREMAPTITRHEPHRTHTEHFGKKASEIFYFYNKRLETSTSRRMGDVKEGSQAHRKSCQFDARASGGAN